MIQSIYPLLSPPSARLCLVLCLTFGYLGTAQAGNIDSLRNIVLNKPGKTDVTTLLREARKHSIDDLPLSLAFVQIAREIALEDEDYGALMQIYRKMGFIYQDNNLPADALKAFERALEIAEDKFTSDPERFTIYIDLAAIHRKLGNYKTAKDHYQKAIDLSKESSNLEIVSFGYSGLGSLYNTIGDHDKAIEYYLKSLEISEVRNFKDGVVKTLREIAHTHTERTDDDLALQTMERAYLLSAELKDTLAIGELLLDYGQIYLNGGYMDEALEKFSQVEQLKKYDHLRARSQMWMADIYTRKKQLDTAEDYFTKAEQNISLLDHFDKALFYHKRGVLHHLKGEIEAAEAMFNSSLQVSKAHLYRDLCQTNYFNLYEIYQNKEEYQKALGFLEMGVSFQDSIYNEKQTKRITELQFKYDVAKSEKEIHTLQLRQNQIMFLGFLILFGVVILFLVSILAIRGKSANVLKRKSKEIQIQNVKLKESNEVLKQFAYVAAHDLKEPLRNIGSFVNLLKKRYGSNFNSEAQEYMGFVTNGARRMNNLLEDLLEYSRISAQAPTREFIDIYEVVNEVSSNLKEKIRRQNARIDCAEDLPKMRMNHLHLVQLFQNLISNAMKFVDGPPIIRISGKTENGYTTISIQDNGIGIDKEFGHKIFNLFHQLNKNKKYEGTGIGLTIVKNIVDKYDGKIWFESEINQGTTFFISIPVDDAQAAPTATVNEKAQVAFAQN